MITEKLKGSFVALVTLFRDGKIDEKGYQDFIEWQIAQGTHGVLAMGTTGESPTLSHEEDMHVVRLAVEAAAGRVPVMAGTGSNSTSECIMLTRHAQEAGADVVLIVTGYYNKPTQEGLFRHFEAVNDAVDIPIVVYNIPGRTGVDIEPLTMQRIAGLPHVVGCKESTAAADRVSRQRWLCGKEFIQMSGEDAAVLGLLGMGGHGCISVTANVAPALCARMHEAWQGGDFEQAREIQNQLMPLHEALFSETSPGPVKYAVGLLGWGDGSVRLPLNSPAEETRLRVRDAMRQAGSPRLTRGMAGKNTPVGTTVARNRKAFRDYAIEDRIEAGIVLSGSETQSLRAGRANINGAFARERDREIWLEDCHISPWQQAGRDNHEPERPRKLLLHRREIERLAGAVSRRGYTLVPLSIYFNPRGVAKVELGLGKGKQAHDKRAAIREREWKRQKERLMRDRG